MKTKTLQIKNFQPFIKYRKYVLLWLFTWVFYGLIMGRKSVQNKKRKSKTSNSIHQIDKKSKKKQNLQLLFGMKRMEVSFWGLSPFQQSDELIFCQTSKLDPVQSFLVFVQQQQQWMFCCLFYLFLIPWQLQVLL